MIDVHSHIVFEVDDGAKSKEQSLQILKEAYDAGFEKIIATPHYMEEYYEIDKHEIKKKIDEIQEELSKMSCNIQILQGNEIYITENINDLLEEKACTLAESQYVLFELPLNAETMNLNKVVYQILENGKIPVLAHPERYPFVQKDPNVLLELIENRVLLQSNFGSIIGQYGKGAKQIIKKMLENNMVHLLGSDVHRPETIYKNISEAIYEIEKIVGKDKLTEITFINPQHIINQEEIEIEEPTKIKNNIFSKIFN